MKKMIAWLLSVLAAWVLVMLLWLQPLTAMAVAPTLSLDEHTISLSSADISFKEPAGMVCFLRDSSASLFSRWGFSQREMLTYMEEYQIYALLFDEITGDQYHISVYPWAAEDLDGMTGEQADDMCESLRAELTLAGYEVQTVSWYQSPGHAFMTAESKYTYEDGSVQEEILYESIQHGYNVQVRSAPEAGKLMDTLRVKTRQIADSMVITPAGVCSLTGDKAVTMQEEQNGTMVFTMPGLTLTAKPLDPLYCVTRESSETVFQRMGFMYKKTLADMQADDCYAMLQDSTQRVQLEIYLYSDDRAPEYASTSDAELTERERNTFLEMGWAVEETGVFSCGPWKFVKTLISYTAEDGAIDRSMVYSTCINGYRVEIWAFTEETKPMMMEVAADAFVRGIQFEMTEE